MTALRRVLLYGNTVILGSVGASLRQCPRLEVSSCEASPTDPRMLGAPKPDILVFDLEATKPEEVFPFLQNDGVALIGVSPDLNLVKVWSGRQLREMSSHGLLEAIDSELEELRRGPVEASREDPEARDFCWP